MKANLIIKKCLLLVFLFSVVCACKKQPDNKIMSVDEVLNYFNNTININTEIFLQESSTLIDPFDFKIFNDVLIVEELMKYDGNIFSVYDMDTKKRIGKFLKQGKGPNEFLGARLFPWIKDSIMVLDVYNGLCQIFSQAKLKNCNSLPDRTIKFQPQNKGEQIDQCIVFDNKVIASGQFKNGMFNMYETNGRFIKDLGQYPNVDYNNEIDNYQLGYIFGPSFNFISNNNNSVAFKYHAGFSIINKNLKEKTRLLWNLPQIVEASYKNGKPIVSQKGEGLLIGAGDITANEKYIFITFSTYDYNNSMKLNIENEYDYILIADWHGKAIGKFKLSNPIKSSIEIDPNGNYIYAMRVDMKTGLPQIIRCNISKFLQP